MVTTIDSRFRALATEYGLDRPEDIRIGGHYRASVLDGDQLWVSGQVPRVGDTVMVAGVVGQDVSLAQAQHAARICTVRALALMQQAMGGSLGQVTQLLRLNVYVRSAADFTQQSEVADAASDLLFDVLGLTGTHTRTSVGVLQLPKGAAVEIDMVARVHPH